MQKTCNLRHVRRDLIFDVVDEVPTRKCIHLFIQISQLSVFLRGIIIVVFSFSLGLSSENASSTHPCLTPRSFPITFFLLISLLPRYLLLNNRKPSLLYSSLPTTLPTFPLSIYSSLLPSFPLSLASYLSSYLPPFLSHPPPPSLPPSLPLSLTHSLTHSLTPSLTPSIPSSLPIFVPPSVYPSVPSPLALKKK